MGAEIEGDVALNEMQQCRTQLRAFGAWLGRRA